MKDELGPVNMVSQVCVTLAKGLEIYSHVVSDDSVIYNMRRWAYRCRDPVTAWQWRRQTGTPDELAFALTLASLPQGAISSHEGGEETSRSMRSSACVNSSPRRSTGPIFVVKITVFARRRGTKPPS